MTKAKQNQPKRKNEYKTHMSNAEEACCLDSRGVRTLANASGATFRSSRLSGNAGGLRAHEYESDSTCAKSVERQLEHTGCQLPCTAGLCSQSAGQSGARYRHCPL